MLNRNAFKNQHIHTGISMHTGRKFELEKITKENPNFGFAYRMQCRDMHRYRCAECYAFKHGLDWKTELKSN